MKALCVWAGKLLTTNWSEPSCASDGTFHLSFVRESDCGAQTDQWGKPQATLQSITFGMENFAPQMLDFGTNLGKDWGLTMKDEHGNTWQQIMLKSCLFVWLRASLCQYEPNSLTATY